MRHEFDEINVPYRRSARLPGYDYAWPGWYAITICAHNRLPLFGNIQDGEMILSPFGVFVEDEWLRTEEIRPEVRLDEFVIMPNHFHGIVVIEEFDGVTVDRLDGERAPFASPSRSLGSTVCGFKTAVTVRLKTLRGTPGVPVWQRSFYDHIIDDNDDLAHTRYYIQTNSAAWDNDPNR